MKSEITIVRPVSLSKPAQRLRKQGGRASGMAVSMVVACLLLAVSSYGFERGLSIGLSFGADEYPAAPGAGTLNSNTAAGVFPQAQWNNLNGANGSAFGLISDNRGSSLATSVSVMWSCPNTWSTTGRGEENNGFATGTGDRTLMTGYLDTSDIEAGASRVTVSGLGPEFTGPGYSVIVYALGGVAGRGGAYSIGSVTNFGTCPSNLSTFVLDAGVDHTDTGNYLTFSGLHDANFTLTANATAGVGFGAVRRAPVNAIQIISSPLDITQPGDPIWLVNGSNDNDADAGPPPMGEGVEHTIDNVGQKYLNFLDLGSGFAVQPQVGLTVVTGIRLYTANDAEPRDPASYVLEGSTVGNAGPWTTISSGPLALPSRRTPGGNTPLGTNSQTVIFPNFTPYAAYRLTFPTLKDAAAANSMQIGEVELLGFPVPASVEIGPPVIPSNIILELDRLYYRIGDPVFVTLKFPSDGFVAPGTNELYVFITSMETKDVEAIRVAYDALEPLVWKSAPLATTSDVGAVMDGVLNVRPGDRIAAVWYPYALHPDVNVEEKMVGDVGLILGPHPGAELIAVNPNLALTSDELTPEPGGKPRGTLLPVNGIPVQIALNEVILIPRDARQLDEFLSRTDGTIVMSDIPPGLEGTGSPTSYLIRVNPERGSLEALPHLRSLLGQAGQVFASNEKALRFWSLCLEYQLQGFVVAANPAMQYSGLPSAAPGETPTTMRTSGPLNVPQLWAFLALWDFDSARIPVAVLDSGFAPSPDLRVPILECDVDAGFVIGPGRAMGPQRVGNSLVLPPSWHGTGVASTLGGLLNNSWPPGGPITGWAGVGGQVVDTMLYYYGLRSYAFEFGLGIRHAAASGASVINISASYPCTIVSKLGIGFDICSPGGRAALCAAATAPLAAASSQICAAVGPALAVPIIGPILALPLTIACSVAVSATATASTACFATIHLGDPPEPMQSAIDFANARGVPIVSIAGNRLAPTSFPPEVRAIVNFSNIDPSAWRIVPGTLRGVICAASAHYDWAFTNVDFSGPRVDLWAPIWTEYLGPSSPTMLTPVTPALPWITRKLGGTSGSAPYICGVIAAMQAINPALNPNTPSLSAAQRAAIPGRILSILSSSAWNAATLNIMAPPALQSATVAAGAARRNLVNPFGAILAAASGVIPDFSSMGYDSRLNFNEEDDAEAADEEPYARELVAGVQTNGTIICIPGLSSSFGLPSGTVLLLPQPPMADVDWWKIKLPPAGSSVKIRVVLTYPTGFGQLVIDSSSLQRVSRTISGLETRDTYETRLHLGRLSLGSLAFRVAGVQSGNGSINLVSDNVYKLLLEGLEVLHVPWPPRDGFDIDLGNDSLASASPLGSEDSPWAPRSGDGGADAYGIDLSGLGFHDAWDVDWFHLDSIPPVSGSCASELEIRFSDDAVCSVILGLTETNLVLNRKQRSPIALPMGRIADAPIYLKLEPAYEAAAVEFNLSLLHRPSAADACRSSEAAVAQGAVLCSPLTRLGSIPFPEVLPELREFPENTHPNMPPRRMDSLGRITTPDWHLIRWKRSGDFAARLVMPADRPLRARLLDVTGVELTRAETADLRLSSTNETILFGASIQTLSLQKTGLTTGSYIIELSHALPETEVEALLPRDAVEAGPGVEDIVTSSYGYVLETQRNIADGTITLKWPVTGQLVELEEADVLPNWHRSSLTPTIVEARTQVVVPASSSSRFFRLALRNP